jgi:hypothetical protein
MTLQMVKTKYEGFPFSYDSELVRKLNLEFSKNNLNNYELIKIGKKVSDKVIHQLHPQTNDGYVWFSELKFPLVNDGKVILLFPWKQNLRSKIYQLERSINVYGNKLLKKQLIDNLINTFCDTTQHLFLKRRLLTQNQ